MSVSAIYLLNDNVWRRDTPVSSQVKKGIENAGEIDPTEVSAPASQVTSGQPEQLSPPDSRVQQHHKVWSSIKLISRRVCQNLRALICTGRLRSAVIENFKSVLSEISKSKKVSEGRCKFYESCNLLLDIGCNPAVVMRELKNKLTADEHQVLEEIFDEKMEELNNEKVKNDIAKKLLEDVFTRYSEAFLKGEILTSHSTLKYIEKLVNHLQSDGIDVLKVTQKIWPSVWEKAAKTINDCSKSYAVQTGQRKKYQAAQAEKFNGMQNRVKSLISSTKIREKTV